MELKLQKENREDSFMLLLIVLNGIEMQHAEEHRRGRLRF